MAKMGSSRRNFLKVAACSGAGIGLTGALGDLTSSAQAADAPLPDKVPRKQLGTTGKDIPILVLGCAQKFDPKYDKILHRAFKSGVNYLDTALVYADGQSHLTIAPFLKQIGDRKKIWITSKGPCQTEGGAPATVASFTKHLDVCLEQLEVENLDLYFMHFIDDPAFVGPEFIKMGANLRKSGKTSFFGFSCHGDRMVECMNKAAEVGGIDAIMFRYSFAKYGDLELNKCIDACKKAGIGLIAMKTQDSVPDTLPAVKSFQSKDFTLAQAKLKAVWADDRIDSCVSHMDNTKKLAENVQAAKSPVQLAMADFQQLQRIATSTADHSCQGCSHICESAYDGPVKIARPLRYLMYHESYDDSARARTLYSRLKPEEVDFSSVDFREATSRCPQGINIAARLTEAATHLA